MIILIIFIQELKKLSPPIPNKVLPRKGFAELKITLTYEWTIRFPQLVRKREEITFLGTQKILQKWSDIPN